ncbi:MAG TPA: hypothetical protein VL992_20830 [Tepidisphaeraceae bacterium]|nr:hypothetical protein [Tepidisphaeraceae bacterium]
MSVLLPRRRIGRLAIYCVCLCLVAIAADLIVVQIGNEIRPGYETTRITSPILPDGSVDYLMAIENDYSSGITEENNAAPLIIRALGRIALSKDQPPDGITDRLGMAHLPEVGDYFVTYDDYCHDHSISGDAAFGADSPLSWPLTITPSVRDWIKANQKPLDLIVQATGRERFYIPWDAGNRPDSLEEVLLPYLNHLQLAAQCLLARSVVRLQAGDIAGFQDDVLSVHRLARLVDQTPTLVELVVALGPIETDACHVDRLAADSGKLSSDQARNLADQLNALRDLKPYVDKVDRGERYMTLDLMQIIAHASLERRTRIVNQIAYSDIPEFIIRFGPIDCEAAMQTLNQCYDGLIIAATQPTFSRRIAAMQLWAERINQWRQRDPFLNALTPDWPACSLMPTLERLETRVTSTKMERRITVIALLLTAYKADHGTYPESLASLPVDSTDLFNDQPLVYAAHANGYEVHTSRPDLFTAAEVRADFDAIFNSRR